MVSATPRPPTAVRVTALLALLLAPLLGCGHAQGQLQTGGPPVVVTAFGPIGTADDSLVFQAAADEAERRRAPLVLPAGASINLRGNVYLGNLNLRAAGAVINCIFDASFRLQGTAKLRGDGCILTKSADGAGYGSKTVSIRFDALTVNSTRLLGANNAKIGLLLENTDLFRGEVLEGTASGTGVGEVTPFDFRRGVQGVRIARIVGHMDNPGGAGGFWIRNDSPARPTAGIEIGSVTMDGATNDELLAIFNSKSADADLHDIHIGSVTLHADGGGGQGMAIFRNVGDYDPARMRRIAVDRVDATVGQIGPALSNAPGLFAVRVHRVDARLGPVTITYDGKWIPNLPHLFGLRYTPGTRQATPLYVPSVTVTVSRDNPIPRGPAAMIWGPVVTDKLVVRDAGSGFRQVAIGAHELRGVDVQTLATQTPLFIGTGRVTGRVNGRQIVR